jgi:alpha-amylase
MSFLALDWCKDSNIYEINLRQYSAEGSFAAFAKSLPRLRDMGIQILWFMPITPISQLNRKGSLGSYYACSDFKDTNPEYGTLEEFKSLVAEAQNLGFKVIIDWVANHTGCDHRWTTEHPEYYLKDVNGNFTEKNGWEDVIDLDYTKPELRLAVIDAMKFWIDACDIDGFRCDMAHLVPLDFWIQARSALDEAKKLFWLAECEVPAYHQAFDATYTWQWMHKSEEFVKHQTDINGLWQLLIQDNKDFQAPDLRTYFTSNHDENSWNGTEYEKYGMAAKNLAVFCCSWNGLPLVYSGQEMPNYKRLKFFDKDTIGWTGNNELADFYKTLLSLRKRNPALRAGDPQVVTYRIQTNVPDKIFSFLRKNKTSEVLVLLNFSEEQIEVTLEDSNVQGIYTNVFDLHPTDLRESSSIMLFPWNFKIFEK